ncbi:MAG: hypothetical protein HY560_04530 [Gemmatimonadetes bacterium]|nr:hypothetical protein [Gemmatimonadota bacterium]
MKGAAAGVPTLPVPLLRDTVAREVAERSLRQAAREIGLSPNGLRNFLNGAAPRSATRLRMERWLAGQARTRRPPSVGHLVRLIEQLGAELSPRQTAALGRDVAELLVTNYQSRRLPPPRWVRELASHYGAPHPKPR